MVKVSSIRNAQSRLVRSRIASKRETRRDKDLGYNVVEKLENDAPCRLAVDSAIKENLRVPSRSRSREWTRPRRMHRERGRTRAPGEHVRRHLYTVFKPTTMTEHEHISPNALK